MKRLVAIAVVSLLSIVALAFSMAAKPDDGDEYRVKVIFDTASNVNEAGDLQVAGVDVGRIGKIGLTPENKASMVLKVTQKGIAPFKQDARCEIVVNSLLGEQVVQCEPGSAGAPELETPSGEDLPLLPVTQTSVPIPVDRVLDTFREPTRDRFRILINELGIAFAVRGDDLAETLRRAAPTLRQTNRVLKILAKQNTTLRDLIVSSDKIMKPLARDREAVADSIVQVNTVAQAIAERREDFSETIERMPPLLRELKPTMEEIGELSDEAGPILADLNAVAPDISRFIIDLGPFAKEAIPAAKTLGDTADLAGPILTKSNPLIEKTDALTVVAKPTIKNLAALLTDLEGSGGIERFMELIFNLGSISAQFDSISHFVQLHGIINTCVEYATSGKVQPNCRAKFSGKKSSSSTSAASAGQKQVLDYLLGD